jgi:hypothetical protein
MAKLVSEHDEPPGERIQGEKHQSRPHRSCIGGGFAALEDR